LRGDPSGNGVGDGVALRGGFERRPRYGRWQPRGEAELDVLRCPAQGEAEGGVRAQFDHDLVPDAVAADELADGHRVEELVGDEQQRQRFDIGEPANMPDRQVEMLQPVGLHPLQAVRRLDEGDAGRLEEGDVELAHGAQDVRHQRAAARPDLGEHEGGGPAEPVPGRDQPGAD
jgi:hypothetical protein